ncbi:hypothetical protein RhiJN_25801 [Ceratobasidium sp. AG-Ba]|nr:hypothetical protein RhiJN_25801 [Ceratobasidium sp. AG-Ba]
MSSIARGTLALTGISSTSLRLSFAWTRKRCIHVEFAPISPFGGERNGRVHPTRAAAAANKEASGDKEEE